MAGYIANWGNDLNSGKSWAKAKKSFASAVDDGLSDLYCQGYFEEDPPTLTEGMNNTIIDGFNADVGSQGVKNMKFLNKTSKVNWGGENIVSLNGDFGTMGGYNCINSLYQGSDAQYREGTVIRNSTLILNYLGLNVQGGITGLDAFKNNILYLNKLKGELERDWLYMNYCLLMVNEFDINGDGTYITPSGANDTEKLADLRQKIADAYGGNPEDYLPGCQIYSGPATDIFNDPDNDDYTLKPGTIATYMSYEGSYVGKYPPSISWIFPTDYTVTSNSFTDQKMDDQTINAVMEGTIKELPTNDVREILTLPVLDFPAYRNGVNMNTEDILANSTISAGDNGIQYNHVYRVEGGTITYDYYPDDPDTTVNFSSGSFFPGVQDSDGNTVTDFTTNDGAVLREVFFENYDRKLKWKFSKSDDTLGSAVEIQLLANQKPMVNTDSDGEPTAGNADDTFDEANAVVLETRYMQPIVYYQAKQIMAY